VLVRVNFNGWLLVPTPCDWKSDFPREAFTNVLGQSWRRKHRPSLTLLLKCKGTFLGA